MMSEHVVVCEIERKISSVRKHISPVTSEPAVRHLMLSKDFILV